MAASKYIYKIFNKRTGKYLSGNKKTHWNSITWVIKKLEQIYKEGKRESYRYSHAATEYKDLVKNELLIEKYEWTLVESSSAWEQVHNVIKDKKIKDLTIKNTKEVIFDIESKISRVVPGSTIETTLSLYNKGCFNESVNRELQPLVDDYMINKSFLTNS